MIVNASDFVVVRQTLAVDWGRQRVRQLHGGDLVFAADDVGRDGGPDEEPQLRRHISPEQYHLTYADADGVVTVRMVTVHWLETADYGVRLGCYCHEAKRPKTFRTDRVLALSCPVTLVVHPDATAHFRGHPQLADVLDREAAALRTLRHELALLVVVGAADGRFDPGEQDVVLGHVFDRAGDLDLDEAVLRQRLCLITPDCDAFERGLERVAQAGAVEARGVIRAMRRLIDADGHLAREELLFAAEIEARLSA